MSPVRSFRGRRLLAAAAVALTAVCARSSSLAFAAPPPPVLDPDYVYSLIDDTNNSKALNDGQSWVVRYYRRITGEAGDMPASNPHPCRLDTTGATGKNADFATGTTTNTSAPTYEDCWWEFMSAWKAAAAAQPGMSPANVTDHYFRLADETTNPYVSASSLNSARTSQPGPFNDVVLTIPGAVHPEQTVVIGEHPDSASLSTYGSAYDDGQGAAVVVATARALLNYWTSNHLWPERTVQFVLFDGEEEGLFGSFHYLSQMVPPGAIDANQITGMFNVDQNGVAYPARHFGTVDKPDQGPWYLNVAETPVSDFSFYPDPNGRIHAHHDQAAAFQSEVDSAVHQAFDQLGQLYAGKPMPLDGYHSDPALGYPTDCTVTTCVPVFQDWSTDNQYLLRYDDNSGGTDQDPFIRCGVNAYGLYGAWDTTQQEPVNQPVVKQPPDVPFAGYDTPVDNVAWLNGLASGSLPPTQVDVSPTNEIDSSKLGSEALRRALQFTGQIVIDSALQADQAGAVPTPSEPIAYFLPDRYQVRSGTPLGFSAIPSPVAGAYSWSFDDGTQAGGPAVSHTFSSTGLHTVTLTASAPSGSSTYTAQVRVVSPTGDLNTACGTVASAAAPSFAASPESSVPEVPAAGLALLVGALAALGLGPAVRRRLRRVRVTG